MFSPLFLFFGKIFKSLNYVCVENKPYSEYDHDHYNDSEYECTSVAASKFREWVHLSINFHIPLRKY